MHNTEKKNNNDTIFNGVFSLLATGAGQSVLQIIVLAFFARLLLPESFGVMAIALAVSDVIRVFARAGVTQAIVQLESINQKTIRVGFTLSFVFSSICCVVLFFSSGFLSELLKMEQMNDVLKVMSLVFPFVSFSLVSEALLSRNFKFHQIAIARLTGYIVGFVIVGISLAYYGFGYWSLIYAYLTQQITQTIILMYKAPHTYIPLYDHNVAKKMLSFGFGYSLGQIANILALRADSFIIARTLGPIALSFYDRSYQLMRFPAFLLATIVDDALFPVFSRMQNEHQMMRKTFSKGIALLAIVLIPLSAVVVLCSEVIIYVLMGSNWVEAIPVLQILAAAMFFRSAQRVSTATLRAKGAVFLSAFIQFIYFLMVILAVYIGGERGINGVAVGVSFAIVLNFVFVTLCAMYIIKLSILDVIKPIIRSLPITLLLSLLTYLILSISHFLNLGHFLTLLFIGLCLALISLLIIIKVPKYFLGTDGLWLLNKLAKKLKVERFLKNNI
jgi:O-antigen/teichoic acid export membrane protein